jgi:hypothetical protein
VTSRELPAKEEFRLKAPDRRVTELQVTAKLMYRKIDQFLLNFLMGEKSGLTTPVSVISEDRKKIVVEAATW